MIVRVKFPYETKFKEAMQTPQGVKVLTQVFGKDHIPEEKEWKDHWAWPNETLIDLDTDGRNMTEIGVDFTVVSFKGTISIDRSIPGPELHDPPQKVVYHVQIPHVGLFAIDKVMVLEDACTDDLQSYLDDGWRILCVCPPNAARRPDYILGIIKELTNE